LKPAFFQAARVDSEPKPVVVRDDAMLTQLAWSPDGKIVATAGLTYELIEGKKDDPSVLARFSPNSTIKLWDARPGELKRSLDEEKNTQITAISFSPDGKTVAIAVVHFP